MARALSQPIGPALLDARPLAYLPRAVRRVLRPAAATLGRVEAVRGFTELWCGCKRSCFALNPPADADPAYVQAGARRLEFNGSFRLPRPTRALRLDLGLAVRVVRVGHLKVGEREFIRFETGGCPDACRSDSVSGTFAARVEIALTMGADLPALWNRQVARDALAFLDLPVPAVGVAIAGALLDAFLVTEDGRLSVAPVLPLGEYRLTPP